jgi:molybdopterin synthase sulfur carrier subunit
MASVRLFAAAREAAGRAQDEVDAATVGDVLDEACRRYGDRFARVLGTSRVWVNGQPADRDTEVSGDDVVAVLPPVSGGARTEAVPAAVPPPPPPPPPPPRPPARPPVVRGNLALVPDLQPEAEDGADGGSSAVERPPLAVVHHSVRPHGRLGLAWAVVTVGLTVAGPAWLGGWLAVAAFLAGAQTCVVWRKRGERPLTFVAATVAAGAPVAASFNTEAMTAVVVAGLLVAFVVRLRRPTRAPSRDIALTVAIAVPVGLAAAAPVLVRQHGIAPTLLLLAFACMYDAGAYLVGTGAASAWEGPAAGVVALIPLTIFAAVVLVPPFAGTEPFLLGLIAAVLTPCGPLAGSALLGDRTAHAPALRRLDSLLLMGPIWAWVALTLLR